MNRSTVLIVGGRLLVAIVGVIIYNNMQAAAAAATGGATDDSGSATPPAPPNPPASPTTEEQNNLTMGVTPTVKPDFSFTVNGTTVAFTNLSVISTSTDNTVAQYLWSFGDGTTSTDPNPTHTYLKEGSYNVNLRASYSGAATASRTKPVAVTYEAAGTTNTALFNDAASKASLYITNSGISPAATIILGNILTYITHVNNNPPPSSALTALTVEKKMIMVGGGIYYVMNGVKYQIQDDATFQKIMGKSIAACDCILGGAGAITGEAAAIARIAANMPTGVMINSANVADWQTLYSTNILNDLFNQSANSG